MRLDNEHRIRVLPSGLISQDPREELDAWAASKLGAVVANSAEADHRQAESAA